MDKEPMSYEESEAIAHILVELGYQARGYFTPGAFGYHVIVGGKHGTGPRFRYTITDAAQLPRAIEDLAAGRTGGDKELTEGV